MSEKIEALTQAAAPDIEPVAWRHHGPRGGWITTEEQKDWSEEPLYSASQLSALQERAERAEAREKEWRRAWDEDDRDTRYFSKCMTAQSRALAAEARVAWLTEALEVISGERPCVDNLMSNADVARAALSHKGEGR